MRATNDDPDDIAWEALSSMPEEYLVCRDMMHAWKITRPFRAVDTTREEEMRTRGGFQQYALRVLTCMRCDMERRDAYQITSARGHTILRKIGGSSYTPPEGYAIPGIGVPRGMAEMVRGAQFEAALRAENVRGRRPRKGGA